MKQSARTVLLVVDDESTVCRVLRRMLSPLVDELLTAENVADAEAILEARSVTHLLCDHLLGPHQPKGMDAASRWRERYPSISTAVILTGARMDELEPSAGIDAVISKVVDAEQLAGALGLGGG
ncbi:MAG: response regulator [Polyangia bacterium]